MTHPGQQASGTDIVIPHKPSKPRKKSIREKLIAFALRAKYSPTAKHLLLIYALLADKHGVFEVTQGGSDSLCEMMNRDRATIYRAHREIESDDIVRSTHGNDRKMSSYTWNLAKVHVA